MASGRARHLDVWAGWGDQVRNGSFVSTALARRGRGAGFGWWQPSWHGGSSGALRALTWGRRRPLLGRGSMARIFGRQGSPDTSGRGASLPSSRPGLWTAVPVAATPPRRQTDGDARACWPRAWPCGIGGTDGRSPAHHPEERLRAPSAPVGSDVPGRVDAWARLRPRGRSACDGAKRGIGSPGFGLRTSRAPFLDVARTSTSTSGHPAPGAARAGPTPRHLATGASRSLEGDQEAGGGSFDPRHTAERDE